MAVAEQAPEGTGETPDEAWGALRNPEVRAKCEETVMKYIAARKHNRKEELLTLLSRPPKGPACHLRVLENIICRERNYVGDKEIWEYLEEEPSEPGIFVEGDPQKNPGAPCIDNALTKQEGDNTEVTIKFDLNKWVGPSFFGAYVWVKVFATFVICNSSGKILSITVGQQ